MSMPPLACLWNTRTLGKDGWCPLNSVNHLEEEEKRTLNCTSNTSEPPSKYRARLIILPANNTVFIFSYINTYSSLVTHIVVGSFIGHRFLSQIFLVLVPLVGYKIIVHLSSLFSFFSSTSAYRLLVTSYYTCSSLNR